MGHWFVVMTYHVWTVEELMCDKKKIIIIIEKTVVIGVTIFLYNVVVEKNLKFFVADRWTRR